MDEQPPRIAYQSDRCTLYAGDCAQLVGHLPTVDLLATDPPTASAGTPG